MFESFLNPQGPIAAAQQIHIIEVFALTMLAILPVFILVPFLLWRYRYGNKNATYKPDWEHSRHLETAMWSLPVVIIGILSIMLVRQTSNLDPYKPIASKEPALRVQAISLDWKWLFVYPDLGIASVGELAFTENRPVSVSLTSDTVMQSFMIPALAGQIYAMPGMQTRLHFLANTTGTFLGENTQYNGPGFSTQRFKAIAMKPDGFEKWVSTVKAKGRPLDQATYSILGKRSRRADVYKELGAAGMPENVVYFSKVNRQLFYRVIAKYRSGKPIPDAEQPGAAAYQSVARATKK